MSLQYQMFGLTTDRRVDGQVVASTGTTGIFVLFTIVFTSPPRTSATCHPASVEQRAMNVDQIPDIVTDNNHFLNLHMESSTDSPLGHLQVVKSMPDLTYACLGDRKLPGQDGSGFKRSTPLMEKPHRNPTRHYGSMEADGIQRQG